MLVLVVVGVIVIVKPGRGYGGGNVQLPQSKAANHEDHFHLEDLLEILPKNLDEKYKKDPKGNEIIKKLFKNPYFGNSVLLPIIKKEKQVENPLIEELNEI